MRIAVALAIGGWLQGWRAPPPGTPPFFGRRQDYPLGRDAGTKDFDLGFQKPELRIVARNEELAWENQKEG